MNAQSKEKTFHNCEDCIGPGRSVYHRLIELNASTKLIDMYLKECLAGCSPLGWKEEEERRAKAKLKPVKKKRKKRKPPTEIQDSIFGKSG